jgi:GAF domain-containing protein
MHTVTPEPAATRRRPPVLGEGLSPRRRLAGALTGLVVLPLLTLGLAQLRDVVGLPVQMLLYLLAVVIVALVGGLVPALTAAAAATVLLDHYFVPPLYDLDVANPTNVVALVAFVLVAGAVSSLVGLAARRTREAETLAATNAASREELRGLAEEQAALRRVLAEEQAALRRLATLVARGVAAGEVFAAVAQEVGSVLGADATNITRLEPDGAVTILARVGAHPAEFPVGSRWTPEPPLALAVALRTGRPARLDDFSQASSAYGDYFRRRGFRSGVAVPIVVEGCLWGGIAVGTRRERFPADTEERLAGFTELIGSAIANAEGRAQLEDSRDELRRLADEQAALRRVATLVARGEPAAELFAAVAQEVGHVLGADATTIARLEPDGAATVLTRVGDPPDKFPLGSRWTIEPPLPLAVAVHTGRPARLDDFSQVAGAYGDRLRRLGIRSGVAAPIIVEGRVWGAIGTGTRREELPAGAEERMAGFTELVGTAIANAEGRAQLEDSRDELRRLAEEQAALRRVATLVARGEPAGEVFAAVAHEVGHVLGADAATIGRLDPDGAMTVLAVVGDHSDNLAVGSRWTIEPPLALAVALRTGRAARCDDYSHASGAFVDATVRRLGIRSSVATPITVEGRLWGAIVAGTRRAHLPADTEQRLAGFTELVGTAIANAEGRAQLEDSRDELRRLADEQAALRQVATLVARGTPPAEVFAAVAHEVSSVLGADATPIARLDPDGRATVLAVAGDPPDALAVGSRWKPEPPLAIAEVLRTGRPARCDDYGQGFGAAGDAVRRMGIRSGVAAPIIVEGRLWGMIAILGRRGLFPADTEQRLAGFTELVGTAIANAEGRAQLEDSRDELRRLADEQAALRQVATLVARATPPEEVFAAVAAEVGQLLSVEQALLNRYDPDGTATALAPWSSTGGAVPFPTGTRWSLGGRNVTTLVFRTRRPARIDDYAEATGPAADLTRAQRVRSIVGAPISVEGRLWGFISVMSNRPEPLLADTEARLARFTELVATALANAEAQAALTTSRARIVAAADSTRRRIERDLHDGTQQRLVAISLTLRLAQTIVPADLPELQTQIGRVTDELTEATEELREIARGIHPAILSEGGLGPALRTLARRAALPVEVKIRTGTRPAEPIEVAAYYVVSEALTNTTKHAHASHADVAVEERGGLLHLSIRDDGVGGADPAAGSGLIGLRDRVQALGGTIEVTSHPGEGTAVLVELPLQPA